MDSRSIKCGRPGTAPTPPVSNSSKRLNGRAPRGAAASYHRDLRAANVEYTVRVRDHAYGSLGRARPAASINRLLGADSGELELWLREAIPDAGGRCANGDLLVGGVSDGAESPAPRRYPGAKPHGSERAVRAPSASNPCQRPAQQGGG